MRGWTMPNFGVSGTVDKQWEWPEWDTANAQAENKASEPNQFHEDRSQILDEQREAAVNYGVNPIGSPPDILYFSAYSAGDAARQHIKRVPVVLQQLSIPYPSDVDYILTPQGVPMPTLMSLDITLIETHAPREYESFSLSAFKQGLLGGF